MKLHQYKVIKAETFRPGKPEQTDAKIRVRPLSDQGVSTDLRIECPRKVRKEYAVGTKFRMRVKMCQREDGSYFLYNYKDWLMKPLN